MGMSPKVRKHLRQNLRAYEALGELRCERAESREAAGAMLEELVALHQERWTQKGQTGAFCVAPVSGVPPVHFVAMLRPR